MEHYKIVIDETARNRPSDGTHTFNRIVETFKTILDIKNFLTDRYGKVPTGRKKVYVDRDGVAVPIGYTHSFWSQDWSHNSKKWYQTDWITFYVVNQRSLDLKELE